MQKGTHFVVTNPLALRNSRVRLASEDDDEDPPESCSAYADASYCGDGESDVTCFGEKYRGCEQGQTDCADNPWNPDDKCCAAINPFTGGDNIDHASCTIADAGWGEVAFCGVISQDSGKK